MQHALEESPELLLQFDGANNLDVERPGKVEVVKGNEPDEVEKDGGGWVVDETQRKTREEPPTSEVESRTGRLKRMYPTLSKYLNEEQLVAWEVEKGMMEKALFKVEELKHEKKMEKRAARSARE